MRCLGMTTLNRRSEKISAILSSKGRGAITAKMIPSGVGNNICDAPTEMAVGWESHGSGFSRECYVDYGFGYRSMNAAHTTAVGPLGRTRLAYKAPTLAYIFGSTKCP